MFDVKGILQDPRVILGIILSGFVLGFLDKIGKLPKIKALDILNKYSLILFNIVNGAGMITKSLVGMNIIQAVELACLMWFFCFDLASTPFDRWMKSENIFEFFHHVLGSMGIALELKNWIGGGMMCWLLADNTTSFFRETSIMFWVIFFSVRVVGYTLIILKALVQSLTHGVSKSLRTWRFCIIVWGVYNLIYHAAWLYRSRANFKIVIRRLLRRGKKVVK